MYSRRVYKLVVAAWINRDTPPEKKRQSKAFLNISLDLNTKFVIEDLHIIRFLTEVQYLKMSRYVGLI